MSDTAINIDIKELNERINKESAFIDLLMLEMNKVIIGQKLLDQLLRYSRKVVYQTLLMV